MLHFLIPRPIAVLLSFAGAILLGLVVMRTLPVGLLPEAPIPQISVQVQYPNAGARALEDIVVRPLREQLMQTAHLEDIESRTRSGSAIITLHLDYGADVDLAFIEVNEKIDQALNLLPRDLERPRVIKANPTDVPVVYLSVTPQAGYPGDVLALNDLTRTVIKRRIEQIPEAAFADRSGFAEAAIEVHPDYERLQTLGIPLTVLNTLLESSQVELSGILLQDGQYQYQVRLSSGIQSPEDLGKLALQHGNRLLYLSELADIQVSPRNRSGLYLHNLQEGVVLAVHKQADAQLFALQTSMDTLVRDLRSQFPTLQFELSNDQSEMLRVSIDNLRSSLGYGALFACAVLFLFFREWRAPLLMMLVVPAALIMTFLGFYLLGLTINIVSLAGLVLGVGLMIDNGIIVIENIRQKRLEEPDLIKACAEGAGEVLSPLLSSALTTCSVFVPLIFLSGLTGALFYDQAISISLALGASLIAAYILLPTLMRLLARKYPQASGYNMDAYSMDSWYGRLTAFPIRFPVVTILLFALFAAWGIRKGLQMKQESFPPLTRNGLELYIDWNEPVNLKSNQNRIASLVEQVNTFVQSGNYFIGEQQFLLSRETPSGHEAEIYFFTDPERPGAPDSLNKRFHQILLQQFPQARWKIQPLQNIFDRVFNAGGQAAFFADIQTSNSNRTPEPEAIAVLAAKLEQAGLPTQLPPVEAQLQFTILQENALRWSVNYESVYRSLLTIFGQNQAGSLRNSESSQAIVLVAADKGNWREAVESTTVLNSEGAPVPLRELVSWQLINDYKEITAGKTGEMIRLEWPAYHSEMGTTIRQAVSRSTGLTMQEGGQVFRDRQLLKEVSIVGLISLGLLYLILAAQFESLLQPLIVLMELPIGIAGALLALEWSGQSLNLLSLIGLVVLSGIVINDSILKVDTANRLRRTHSAREAIHLAGARRLRPILMTTLTTILALVPQLFAEGIGAELQRPLAFAVMGGLTMGTIASLYFIPAVYVVLDLRRQMPDTRRQTF